MSQVKVGDRLVFYNPVTVMQNPVFKEFKITGFRTTTESGGELIQVEATQDMKNLKKMLAEDLNVTNNGEFSDWIDSYLIA